MILKKKKKICQTCIKNNVLLWKSFLQFIQIKSEADDKIMDTKTNVNVYTDNITIKNKNLKYLRQTTHLRDCVFQAVKVYA